MCGVAGIVRYGEQPITEEMISLLLTGNEHRGVDATGLAFSQNDGTVDVFKKDIQAWTFVEHKDYLAFIKAKLKPDTWGVILHTRAATKGNPRHNENNHPMFLGSSAVVHNGVLHNDDSLFHSEKFKRGAETDSDILRAFVDAYGITGQAIKQMNKISGSAAGAAFDPRYPHKMLLFRSGNPMTLASTENYFMFSSEKGTVYRALKPFVKRWGMWFQRERADAAFSPMADNTAWILGDAGQEFHGEFKTLGGKFVEPTRKTYENYKERQARWNNTIRVSLPANAVKTEERDEGMCPKCNMIWNFKKGAKWGTVFCNDSKGGCGTALVAKPKAAKEIVQ